LYNKSTTKKKDLKKSFKNTKEMDKKMYFNESIEAAKCNKKW
jgi:hypothetical protein